MAQGMNLAKGNILTENIVEMLQYAVAGNGVISGMAVAERGAGANMSVDVSSGVYRVNNILVTKAATTNVVITAADASNPRKDIIVADSAGTISVVDGTPAAAQKAGETGPDTRQPTAPNIPANKILLAEIWVAAAVTEIYDADITELGALFSRIPLLQDGPTELTISGGSITPTGSYHTVDTEGDAASDDLDTIDGETYDGMFLALRPANDARTVIVRHNVGNIWMMGSNDVTLDDLLDGIFLVFDEGENKWFGVGGSLPAHKDTHDPEDGSDPLDTAAPSELASVQAAGVGTSHSLARADHQHQIQHGITDNHLVTVDGPGAGAPASGEYAKWTASGIEGKSLAEVLADLSGQAAAAFDWNNQDIININQVQIGPTAIGAGIDLYAYRGVETDPAGTLRAILTTRRAKATGGASAASLQGIYSEIQIDPANTQNWTAAKGMVALEGFLKVYAGAAGIITRAIGLYLAHDIDAGTVSNAEAIHIEPLAPAGTVTNDIGIVIENLVGTNRYGLYYGSWTQGQGIYIVADGATALDGALTAIKIDLNTNYTNAANHQVKAIDVDVTTAGTPKNVAADLKVGGVSFLLVDEDGVVARQAITDNHVVTVDGPGAGAPASGEYAKWTASGIEGRTYAELRADINVADGADVTGDNAPQAHASTHQWLGSDEMEIHKLFAGGMYLFGLVDWQAYDTTNIWTEALSGTASATRTFANNILQTGATQNSVVNIYSTASAYFPDVNGVISFSIQSQATLDNSEWWYVLMDATTPGATTKHVGFFIEDGEIYATNADGATQTITDTGVSIQTAWTAKHLTVFYDGASLKFYIGATLKATHTTNIPVPTVFRIMHYGKNDGAAENEAMASIFTAFLFKA